MNKLTQRSRRDNYEIVKIYNNSNQYIYGRVVKIVPKNKNKVRR